MAILTTPQISTQHWYTADGVPFHEMNRADGNGTRPTTLRDARKLGLYCSVSELLGAFAKPGLIKWQIKKAINSALTLKRKAGESDEYFVNRILEDANAEVKAAADFGTGLHNAMEDYFKPSPQLRAGEKPKPIPVELLPYCNPVIEYINAKGFVFIETETIIVNHRFGFAGTLDVAFAYGPGAERMPVLAAARDYDELRKLWEAGIGIGILDYKTRKTSAGVEVTAYDNQATQIVAYGATYFATLFQVPEADVVKRLYGANVFISSTEKGRYHVEPYTPVNFEIEWLKLVFVSAIWRLQTSYAPHKVEFPLLLQEHVPTRSLVRGMTEIASADPLKLAYDVTTPAGDGDLLDVDRLFDSKNEQKKAKAKAKRDEKKAKLAAELDAEAEAPIVESDPVKAEIAAEKEETVAELSQEMDAAEEEQPKAPSRRRAWSAEEDAFIIERLEKDVPFKIKAEVLNKQLHDGEEIRKPNSYRQREAKLAKAIEEEKAKATPPAKKAAKKTAKKTAKKAAKKAAKRANVKKK